MKSLFLSALLMCTSLLVGCNEDKGLLDISSTTNHSSVLTKVQVTPAIESTAIGLSHAFSATAYFDDGTTKDIANDARVTWKVDDASVASINKSGLATGVGLGTTSVVAEGDINGILFSETASLTVTDAVITALQVTPPTQSAPIGLIKTYQATALLSDGTTQDISTSPTTTWSTGDTNIATISATGEATGLSIGSTSITASITTPEGTLSANAILDVTKVTMSKLIVSPDNSEIPLGLTKQLTATAYFDDGTTQNVTEKVTWSTPAPHIASVNSKGEVTAHLSGMGVGFIQAELIVDSKTFWDDTMVYITPSIITALNITPHTDSIAVGATMQFHVNALMSDGTSNELTNDNTISWTSSDTTIATIVSSAAINNGLATGISIGGAIIKATTLVDNQPIEATATLNVSASRLVSISVSPSEVHFATANETATLVATGHYSDGTTQDITAQVSWSGQDTSIATVINGIVTAVGSGGTHTIATFDDGNGTRTHSPNINIYFYDTNPK